MAEDSLEDFLGKSGKNENTFSKGYFFDENFFTRNNIGKNTLDFKVPEFQISRLSKATGAQSHFPVTTAEENIQKFVQGEEGKYQELVSLALKKELDTIFITDWREEDFPPTLDALNTMIEEVKAKEQEVFKLLDETVRNFPLKGGEEVGGLKYLKNDLSRDLSQSRDYRPNFLKKGNMWDTYLNNPGDNFKNIEKIKIGDLVGIGNTQTKPMGKAEKLLGKLGNLIDNAVDRLKDLVGIGSSKEEIGR